MGSGDLRPVKQYSFWGRDGMHDGQNKTNRSAMAGKTESTGLFCHSRRWNGSSFSGHYWNNKAQGSTAVSAVGWNCFIQTASSTQGPAGPVSTNLLRRSMLRERKTAVCFRSALKFSVPAVTLTLVMCSRTDRNLRGCVTASTLPPSISSRSRTAMIKETIDTPRSILFI